VFKKHNSHTFLPPLIFALTISFSGYCKGYISWYSESDRAIHRISVLNGNHNVFYENNIDTLPIFKLNYPVGKLNLPSIGHHFYIQNELICVFGGTGNVFGIDTASKEIRRIDNTAHSGYNFDAYQFSRKDTIFSFGGYGFWMENNLLTYFSTLRKEWNVYAVGDFPPYNPDYTKGTSYTFAFYDKSEDALFVLRQTEFWKFDFASTQWEKLGSLVLDNVFPTKGSTGISRLHRMNDTTVMLMGGLKAYYIVPKNNIIYDVTLPNGLNAGVLSSVNPFGFHCGYDLENELVMAKFSNKLPNGYLFEFVNRLPKRINQESKLYSQEILSSQVKLGLSLGGFLFIGVLLTYWIRRLYLKRRYQYFTEAQWKFIQLLDKRSLQTEELNEFLELGSSSWEVQRRKRSEYIKMINDLCLNQLGCELVLRERSKEDKRQILYVMNVEAKNKLARLM